MTRCTRFIGLGLLTMLTMLAASLSASLAAGQRADSVERWAEELWEAAQRGDLAAVESHCDSIPADDVEAASAKRFRESLAQFRANRDAAATVRNEERSEALGKMREELEAEHLEEALRQAVTAQTLSEDYNGAFADPEIMQLVGWAKEHVPELVGRRQWLDAQVLLYRLRTFYEDTDRHDEFDRFDEQLEEVNQRVALIARYAPRQLHEMRNERRERLGEEPLGEFNPGTAVDWRERLGDINSKMLKGALELAANRHIDAQGWRPLLEGGLEAMRLFVTTAVMSETFPELADREHVTRWVRYLDDKLEQMAATADEPVRRVEMLRILGDLTALNDETIHLPREVIFREFGDGAMNRLDIYSEIIWPDKLHRFVQQTSGNFPGVGILIRHNDKREIMVVNPLEGTPAYFAGVKPDDLIMEVDGQSTVGWSLSDAVDVITGRVGTSVTLGVQREGVEGIIQIPMVRDIIKIRSIKGWWKRDLDENGEPIWDWYIDSVSRIAYIRLTQFTEDTPRDFWDAWRQIRRDENGPPSGLVLDMRHNPGGLLTAAVDISNFFIRRGEIVRGEDRYGDPQWHQKAVDRNAFLADAEIPTVVLINQGSASGTEIVAGALQAHGAAIIVGERSFGKGVVQTVHPIDLERKSRIKLTTQRYRLPSPDGGKTPGRLVHRDPDSEVWGVDPDIEVPMSAKQVIDTIELRQGAEIIPLDDEGNLNPDDPERPDVNDLLTKGIDPQLETALLILRARALATETVRHAARRTG